jgi:hypothetical protein
MGSLRVAVVGFTGQVVQHSWGENSIHCLSEEEENTRRIQFQALPLPFPTSLVCGNILLLLYFQTSLDAVMARTEKERGEEKKCLYSGGGGAEGRSCIGHTGGSGFGLTLAFCEATPTAPTLKPHPLQRFEATPTAHTLKPHPLHSQEECMGQKCTPRVKEAISSLFKLTRGEKANSGKEGDINPHKH